MWFPSLEMTMLDRWIRLKSLLSRRHLESEVDSELEHHIEMLARRYRDTGYEPDEAVRQALQRFGDRERIRDQALHIEGDRRRSRRRTLFVGSLGHDLRFALRTFRRNPVFTLAAVMSLAIGIGANTAVLVFVHEFLFDPLPFEDASRIVSINCSAPTLGIENHHMTFAELEYFRTHARTLETVAANELTDVTITGGEEPERIFALRTSTNFFDIFGVPPLYGRTFIEEDGLAGASGTVVLGYNIWQRLFGGDLDLLGHTVRLNEESFTVIGIMPPDVTIPYRTQIWMPFREDRLQEVILVRLRFNGRIAAGASVTSVRDELDALFVQLGELYPEESTEKRATVTTLRAGTLQSMQESVLIFYAVVSLLLLLVCANVANLLLARGSARERELAVRSSLGAGRGRIVRQLFTESLLLALTGGAIGLLLGSWGRDLYLAGTNMVLPSYLDFSIDLGFIALQLAITLAATLLFGLVPALVTTRSSLGGILNRSSTRAGTDRSRSWHQSLLVGLEIGLATMVLIAGGLMLKSFIGIQGVELGFEPENVVHMEITLDSLPEMTPLERIRYYDDLIARIEEHPLVESAAAGNPLPYISWESSYEAEGGSAPEDGVMRTAMDGTVTPGFMETLGVPLVLGRDFSELDYGQEMNVVLVSERLAEINWPGENPLGKRIRYVSSSGREYPWMEVIGIVGDTRAGTFQPDGGWFWVVNGQVAAYELIVVARVRADAQQVLTDMKRMVWDENPELALAWSGLLAETVQDRWYDSPRLYSTLLSLFSIMALLLACVGVYGVISYTVTRRGREFGIRLSIGARPVDVIRRVMLEGGRLVLFGLAGGLLGAIVLTHLAASIFFGVNPHDPVIYVLCTLVLAVTALLATWLPARRAARIDPVEALRTE